MPYESGIFFHCTCYRFLSQGRDELCRRFYTVFSDQTATCRYIGNEDVFELESALEYSDEVNSKFAEILNQYIEHELNSAHDEGRLPNVQRIPESCIDGGGNLFIDAEADSSAEDSVGPTPTEPAKACSVNWKPKTAVALPDMIDDDQMQLLALRTGCSLSKTYDKCSILVRADEQTELEDAVGRLTTIERSQCFNTVQVHLVDMEGVTDDFRLRCFRPSATVLRQTLVPENSALADKLHYKLVLRWLKFDKVTQKFIVQSPHSSTIQATPHLEELSKMWMLVVLEQVGDDRLQPAESTAPSRISSPAIIDIEADKVGQVNKWISDIDLKGVAPVVTVGHSIISQRAAMSRACDQLEELSMRSTPPSLPVTPKIAASQPPTVKSMQTPSTRRPDSHLAPSAQDSTISTKIVRSYEETSFGNEPWAKNVVVASGKTGKLIALSTDSTNQGPPIAPTHSAKPRQQSARVGNSSRSISWTGESAISQINKISIDRPHTPRKPAKASSSYTPAKAHILDENSQPALASGARSNVNSKSAVIRTYSGVAKSSTLGEDGPAKTRDSARESYQDSAEARSRHLIQDMEHQPRKMSRKQSTSLSGPSRLTSLTVTVPLVHVENTSSGKIKADTLLSPLLEAVPDKHARYDGSEDTLPRGALDDLIGLDLTNTARPVKIASPMTPEFRAAALRVLEVARPFRGNVGLEVQFGRILLSDMNKELRAGHVTKEHWEDSIASDGCTTEFTSMLTASALDTAFILSLKAADGRRFFEAKPCVTHVNYLFDCASARQGSVRFSVDQDNADAFIIESAKSIGSIYAHQPKRTWDCRLTLIGHGAGPQDPLELSAIKSVVDCLYVRVPNQQTSPVMYFKEQPRELSVNNVLVRKEMRFRSTLFPSLALKMVEVQALVLGRRPGDSTVKAWATDKVTDMVNARRHWYEVGLAPLKPLAALEENKKLDLGDEAAWTAEDLLKDNEDVWKGLQQLAQHVVTRIDNVGCMNRGPRGGPGDTVYWESVKVAPKEEIGFW